MLRRGVVICLIGVLAAGPWVCCCTAARLSSCLTASPAAVPGPPAQPDLPPCCQHERTTPATCPCCPAPDQQPQGPGCPCKHDTDRTTLATAPAAAKTVEAQLAPLVPAALSCRAVGPAVAPTPCLALPFWTSGDLLCRCHLLRC